ncbi:MAG: hypothetical protein ABR913_05635 [Sedimentisphaerales bacterium]|jgi:hypothetical protein
MIGAGWIFGSVKFVIELIKTLLPKKAKPKLLKFENCRITPLLGVHFEFWISNLGSKDCSLFSIKLAWPDGSEAELGYGPSTPLPKTIPSGTLAERIIAHGKYQDMPDKDTILGTATLEFNPPHKPIIEKTQFTIEYHPLKHQFLI